MLCKPKGKAQCCQQGQLEMLFHSLACMGEEADCPTGTGWPAHERQPRPHLSRQQVPTARLSLPQGRRPSLAHSEAPSKWPNAPGFTCDLRKLSRPPGGLLSPGPAGGSGGRPRGWGARGQRGFQE